MHGRSTGVALVSCLVLLAAAPAAAQESVAEFYRGKVIRLLLSAGEGGGYGTYANAIKPYMTKYLPGNPTIIVQHMQGAGGLVAANYMGNIAPRDGTMMALIHRAAVSTAPLFGHPTIKYDPRKLGWIGSMNNEKSVCAVWHTSKVQNFEDLQKIPITVAGQGPGGDPDVYANFLNNVFGTKMRLITGYDSGGAMNLAIERGEVEGRCHWSWSAISSTKMSWITEKKVRLIIQLAFEKHEDLPDVPLITDYVKSEEQRQMFEIVVGSSLMGRPFLTPPDVPAERLKALRTAFVASMKDPGFIADAKAQNLEYSLVTGEEIEALITRMYSVPRDIVEKTARAVESKRD